ncbi:Shikimate 5-dehydrogenase-like protein [Corynebacterium occultum]|uniref:Shikimate 5-dehydrogenase-like protein n=1 Tax=Corynebacterium occultum TaxID=2675219 RepID=A0A6B8W0I6_9CORY|nr:shikimate 5-dehydrogenase [Corynebacterium occultum]QGU07024.1 Shikimate 5-dehydrogenase-like protein [Corynebacterium occultum]
MVNQVDRETTLCISLAARPGNHGVRFHNWLYDRYQLNFLYKAFAPEDITAAVAGIRGLGIRGAGVSMPYKEQVIPLLDALDPSAERIRSVNTILNEGGDLIGYNTDYLAVAQLIREVDPTLPVTVRGSGGMANAVVAALSDHGMSGTVVARNHVTGASLARRFGWEFSTETPAEAKMLVNVTPLGMAGGNEGGTAFSEAEISRATLVFDVVADPVRTPLITTAEEWNIPYITGGEVLALQAAEQFTLYTGVRPSAEDIATAEAYATEALPISN